MLWIAAVFEIMVKGWCTHVNSHVFAFVFVCMCVCVDILQRFQFVTPMHAVGILVTYQLTFTCFYECKNLFTSSGVRQVNWTVLNGRFINVKVISLQKLVKRVIFSSGVRQVNWTVLNDRLINVKVISLQKLVKRVIFSYIRQVNWTVLNDRLINVKVISLQKLVKRVILSS